MGQPVVLAGLMVICAKRDTLLSSRRFNVSAGTIAEDGAFNW